jgi:putative hydrolase of the HAD superfamily
MLKAVLFDLDGTLLNRDESVKVFVNRQYDRLKNLVGHIPKAKYVKRLGGRVDGYEISNWKISI